MAENPPTTTSAPANSTNNATTTGATSDQSSTRGIPYYEKLRRELRDTIQKKRLMDKNMSVLEESIYRFEQSYLEETGAGNIIKGFDNYIKGASASSNPGAASGLAMGSSFGAVGGGGGGPNTRKRGQVSDADRVFSRSSASFMNDSPAPSSTHTTPTHATTPISSGAPGAQKDNKETGATANSSTKGGNNKKTKKSGGGGGGGGRDRNDGEDDGDATTTKPPAKRLKITYSRGGN